MSEQECFATQGEYFSHARAAGSNGDSSPKQNFKYYAKVAISPKKDRYFYSKEEYLAYLSKKSDADKSDKSESAKKILSIGKKILDGIVKKVKTSQIFSPNTTLGDLIDMGKKVFSDSAKKLESSSIESIKKENAEKLEYAAKKVKYLLDKKEALIKDDESDKHPEKSIKPLEKPNQKAEQEKATQKVAIEELSNNKNHIPNLDIKTEACSKEEDMAKTNPNYGDGTNFAYNNNCVPCVIAYDLRQRGYDVEAAPALPGEENLMHMHDIINAYSGVDSFSVTSILGIDRPNNTEYTASNVSKRIESDLLKHGNGARGVLTAEWKNGGGHVVIWEVEDEKVVIRDPQMNEVKSVYDIVKYSKTTRYFRLDNSEPKRWYFEDSTYVINSNRNKEDE